MKTQNKKLIFHFMERLKIYVTKSMVPLYGFKIYWLENGQKK
jgi:hypothetical protein